MGKPTTMKYYFIKNIIFIIVLVHLASCAPDRVFVPNYDFSRKYDINEINNATKDIDRPPVDEVLNFIKKNTIIGFSWIDAPLNQITLIRDNNSMCAIRFISHGKGGDRESATSFSSGEESFFAEYEIYSISLNENTSIGDRQIIVHKEKVNKFSTFGIGRLAFGGGNSTIKCGESEFFWSFPTGVFIAENNKMMKFSPTKLNDFHLINLQNTKIVWYGYEENRKMLLIPTK